MNTDHRISVESRTKDVNLTITMDASSEDFDKWELASLDQLGEEEMAVLAGKLGIDARILTGLATSFESLRDAVHDDLADIWLRMDRMESR